MENTNEMTIIFDSYSSNEAFARVAVAAFMTSLNPTVEEVADVKTAVSEAVTNAIIHGYESRIEKITLRCKTCGDTLYIEIEDHGKGMEDVKKAMEPLFTTRPELDRSGMGFSFMEAFMDQVEVSSKPGKGTIVKMQKTIGKGMEDVKKAMEPLFTTRPELDRSGMGFSFMEAFMDQVEVSSKPGKGTIVKMQKTIGKGRKVWTTQSL